MRELDLQVTRQSATLRGQVEEKIRQAIASGVFKPGQRLIERELCEQIGVGRTSIREALRQLEAEGLIVSYPHRGPVVATVSAEDAEHLYELRGLLESYSGQQCAQNASIAIKQALNRAVEEFELAANQGDRKALISAKTEFYELLMEGGGNPYVSQALTSLHNRINLLRFTSMTQPGRLQHSVDEIKEIVAAILASDGPRAAKACKFHIEQAADVALEYLRHSAKSDE